MRTKHYLVLGAFVLGMSCKCLCSPASTTNEAFRAAFRTIDPLLIGFVVSSDPESVIGKYGPPHETYPDMIRWFNVGEYQQLNLIRGTHSNDWTGYRIIYRDGTAGGQVSIKNGKDRNDDPFDAVDRARAKHDYETFEALIATSTSRAFEVSSCWPRMSDRTNMVQFWFSSETLGGVAHTLSEWCGEKIETPTEMHLDVNARSPGKMTMNDAFSAMTRYLDMRGVTVKRDDKQRLVLQWIQK